MLRALDEKFGVGIYTRNIVDALLQLNCNHQYVLFYRDKKYLGRYAHYSQVEEKVVNAPNKLLWDQLAIPLVAHQAKLDVLFHPKFTVPFLASCKTVMTIHGASPFVRPDLYPNKVDLRYFKSVMPLYCQKADAIISNSHLTHKDFVNILQVPEAKIRTIYFGINPIFKVIKDPAILAKIKTKYHLPERFILTVSRYDPRKNFETIFKAFSQCGDAGKLKLVAVGKDSWKYREDCGIDESSLVNDVFFPGYVEQDDLPAFYNLAEVFIFPSVYEEFGIPLLEAMACGCPIVASNTGAIPEITNGAAFLTNPYDAEAMAIGIDHLTQDNQLRNLLINKSLQRTKQFNWDNTARATLKVLEQVVTC